MLRALIPPNQKADVNLWPSGPTVGCVFLTGTNPSKAHVFTVSTVCDLCQHSCDSGQFPHYPTCSTYGNTEAGVAVCGRVRLEESGKRPDVIFSPYENKRDRETLFPYSMIPHQRNGR